jgi:hypothetical protein
VQAIYYVKVPYELEERASRAIQERGGCNLFDFMQEVTGSEVTLVLGSKMMRSTGHFVFYPIGGHGLIGMKD